MASGVIIRGRMSADSTRDGGPGPSGDQPEVYDELRKLARARLARERERSQSLQSTVFIQEPYPGAGDRQEAEGNRRGHFFAAAALAMRRILVDRARHYQRIRHGSDEGRDAPDSAMMRVDPSLVDLVAVDAALTRLEQTDPRKAQIVSLRYF